MKILGISAFYHDSAAALIKDGEIIAAAQEERFSRKKHDASFPSHAIRFCLDYGFVDLDELDAIAFYDKPLLKFERLLETYYAFSPSGLKSFITAIPVWIKEKMFLKKMIIEELQKIQNIDKKQLNLLFPEHHLSHAASAFYPSPYSEAAILTLDGVGEWATASICQGNQNNISILKELNFPHSLGLLYSAFTYYLGFRVNSGEYKLMGLAPYGNEGSDQVNHFIETIKDHLIEIHKDGSIWLNQKYFKYATGLRMTHDKKWEELFQLPRRTPETQLEQIHCDMALAIQKITEEVVINMAQEAKKLTQSSNLCLAGGVALNCVANGKLLERDIFKNIYIQPAAGDAGGALGAAQAAHYLYFQKPLLPKNGQDLMKGAYLGSDLSDMAIKKVIKKFDAKATHFDDFNQLCDQVAQLISQGSIIGWMQGRMEFGPRALGSRSILGDARNPEMQKKLNLKIKYRESFRPFAPSVLAEDVRDYFDLSVESPYMLLVRPVSEKRRCNLPDNYASFTVKDKLYYLRSDIPAVTHVDYSARIQTVHQETNPRYHRLISKFKEVTQYGLIVNTSFNVRGEPIVCTPEDGYRCFMRTEMDYLVINNYLFSKTEQPEWKEKDRWQEEYTLD